MSVHPTRVFLDTPCVPSSAMALPRKQESKETEPTPWVPQEWPLTQQQQQSWGTCWKCKRSGPPIRNWN